MLIGGSLMCAGFVFVGGSIWYGQRRQEKMMTKAVYAPPVAMPAPQPALIVPDGKRAVSVRVTSERAGIGPLGMLGHRVDVLSIMPDPNDDRKSLSKVVVEDVLVLAVNTGAQTIVTLAVTPEQAEKLDDAKERGSITLEPRRPEE
jgi:Flp pilus assembly protein CpaB